MDRGGREEALRNHALIVLVVLIWASSWPIIKIAVSEVPPIWFGVLRYLIATVVMLPLLMARRLLILPPRADWPLILVSGALQMGVYAALMGVALVTLPPGRASVLAYSTPLWVVPMAGWWLKERVTTRDWVAAGMGVLGMLVIASPSLVLKAPQHVVAYLALAAASLVWAISIVFVRGHKFQSTPLALAPWQMMVAVTLLVPCAFLWEGALPPLGARGMLTLSFVGPVSTAFAYWAMVEAGRYFRASTISLALMATPIVGILISTLTLGERVDASLVVGVVLVAGAICMATIAPARDKGGAE